MLDKIIKYGLYLLVFLLPLFFLPFTIFPVAQNKQMLLSVFAFLLLILWLIKIIISGKLSFVWNKLVILMILLLLILGISTALSGSWDQSFWGMAFEPDTFFNFLLYALVFFLVANTRIDTDKKRIDTDKEIRKILISFLGSAALLALLFLVQAFTRKPIFPWVFAQSITFNPIGTAQGLGLFLGGSFVMLVAIATNTLITADQNADKPLKKSALSRRIVQRKFSVKSILKRVKHILPIILGILLFACILLINYWPVWLGICLATVIIMAEMTKSIGKSFGQTLPSFEEQNLGGQKELKRFFLPLIILVFSLIFIFIQIPTQNIVAIAPEISLTYRASFDIAIKTLKESPKNLILGSGPATFAYQYSLFRTADLNLTNFWQLRFNQGIAGLLTFLTTFGVLGSLVILLLIGFFFYQGLKPIYLGRTSVNGTQLATFVGGSYFFLIWFFYPLNFTLGFAAFLFLGLWMAAENNADQNAEKTLKRKSASNRRIYQRKISVVFSESPQAAFFTMMICVVLIVVCAVGLYNVSQKYRGALVYAQGLSLIAAEEPKLDEAIIKLNQVALLDRKDVYFRNLSELFLIKMNQVVNDEALSQEQKQELFQQVVANAEASATAAIRLNPQNSQNWFQLSAVYENLAILGLEGAGQIAVLNYEKTQELDPLNPQIPLNMGRVYKTEVERIKIQIAILEASDEPDEQELAQNKEAYSHNFDLSMQYFQKSLELKPNFSAAYFLIAQNYETNGEDEKALENYRIVLQLEPGNEEVQARIDELTAD